MTVCYGGAMPQNCPNPCGRCTIIHDGKRAQLCPVCGGSGYVVNSASTACNMPCHGCQGKGWVTV